MSKIHDHQWQRNDEFFIISVSLTFTRQEVCGFCTKLMIFQTKYCEVTVQMQTVLYPCEIGTGRNAYTDKVPYFET